MRDFELTEYELHDVAGLLAGIPTKIETTEKEHVEYCPECENPMCHVFAVTHEEVDTMDREFIRSLVARVGEIYDIARARAIRKSVA